MDLEGMGLADVDEFHLAPVRDPVGGSCEHSNEPSCSIKAGNSHNSRAPINFAIKAQLIRDFVKYWCL
jgi:hypothetical protein